MIDVFNELLYENEINLLIGLAKNDNIYDTPNFVDNDYLRIKINLDNDFLDYKKRIENYLYKYYQKKYELTGLWINKINNETNKNDEFHFDYSDLTIVTYLNEDFVGGELVYLNKSNQSIKIIPQKNLSLIMYNKVLHKVNSVKKGVRYSLVGFFNNTIKNDKTLM